MSIDCFIYTHNLFFLSCDRKDINNPAKALWELAKSEDKLVKASIAENPNSPPELLIKLFPTAILVKF